MKKSFILVSMFLILAFGFFGCSTKSAEELYNEGLLNQKEQNYEQAVDLFEKAGDKDSDGKFAPKAYLEIATIYYAGNIKNISKEESFSKAITYYEKVYENYPQSEQAPRSLFMKGFIESNEQNNFEAATKTFNEFLEKYPNNEMAEAAKAELENMGLSPDEVLNKKVGSAK